MNVPKASSENFQTFQKNCFARFERLFKSPWIFHNMAEDIETSEKEVLHDLNQVGIDDLRRMARNRGLCPDGKKTELVARIKTYFGFGEDDQENLQMNVELNKNLQNCTEEEGKI